MKDEARQTRTHLIELFERHGLHPRTMFGQNFLIDINIIESIVRAGDLHPNDVVLEVGAGTGGMTTYLSTWAGRVVSVEIDRDMFALASEAVAGRTNVRLLNQDALKSKNTLAPEVVEAVRAALREVSKELGRPPRLKLIANLPYSVATPIVSNLIASDLPWRRMVITIQYELALRMIARPGKSHYGSLSVWCQSHGRVELLRKLGPKVFWPRPQVDSAVVRIVREKSRERRIADRDLFHDFIRRVFQNRRKTLRSTLSTMYKGRKSKAEVDEFLATLDYDENTRAEAIDVWGLVRLSNRLHAWLKGVELSPEMTDDFAPSHTEPTEEGAEEEERGEEAGGDVSASDSSTEPPHSSTPPSSMDAR